jgi:nucleotide-binding universal stress UspA family protein
MATHGRTGMARFALGSVADRVARFGRTPVLMVRPFGDAGQAGHLERALVPLDGSTVSSQALNIVLQLAGTVIRQARLVSVVDPDQPSGATNDAQRMLGEAQALLLLDLEGRECAVDTAILYGKVADQIVERSRQDCDVVIMGTHGLVGIDRWAYGSMADRVLHGIDVPLLLVNARGDI